MTDRMDAQLNAITTELASSAPLPPPMPPLASQRRPWVLGASVAAAAFAGIVLVAVAALTAWTHYATTVSTASASEVFESAGATPVAVVMRDGNALRGYLWVGNEHGTLIMSAYGERIDELLTLATSAHADGATVMLIDPRGQGGSGGAPSAGLLVSDMEDGIADLTTRGVSDVVAVGIRHTATAAIVVSTEPPDTVRGVVAFFPFEQYQGVDAIGVVADAGVPLTIVGASAPSHLGPWAGHLAAAAPDGTTGILLPPLPSDEEFLAHYMGDMVAILRSASTG
jgi:hypothetical protein